MHRLALTGLAVAGLLAWAVAVATSQPPTQRRDDRREERKDDRPPSKEKEPEDKERGPERKGPPTKGYQLGKLLPPHIRHEIDLTPEQERQLAELEKEARKRLEKLLTEKQRRQVEKMGKPPIKDNRPGKDKGKRPPPRDDGD